MAKQAGWIWPRIAYRRSQKSLKTVKSAVRSLPEDRLYRKSVLREADHFPIHDCATGRYSSGVRPKVQATACRAVATVGGTASQYSLNEPSGSGVWFTTRTA